MPDDAVAIVRAMFDPFNDGDLARAAETVSGGFELVDVAADQTFHGPDGCRQWLTIFRDAPPRRANRADSRLRRRNPGG